MAAPMGMKLYGMAKLAPNPRRVRIFLAEKGIDLAETQVDVMKGEQRTAEFMSRNSLGQIPVLELDDGVTIAESVAICRYFEEVQPEPPLFGRTPVEKAQVEMWVRRIEFVLTAPLRNFWRHAHPATARQLTQFKDFGESNRAVYVEAQGWLHRELGDRAFIAGDAFTIADVCALTTLDFGKQIGLPIETGFTRISDWRTRIASRASAGA